jgi:hypothetical protein
MLANVEKLREIAPSLSRFLEFERELEDGIRQEFTERRMVIEETKRAQEKRARKKRLRKMRAVQQQ